MGIICIGLDLETSGLEAAKDRIIEIEAVTWICETKMPMQILSKLVDPYMENEEFVLPAEITELTGITTEALGNYGVYEKDALAELNDMAGYANYFVGHNGNIFDRPFLEEAYKRNSMEMPDLPWIDTITDIKFDKSIKTRNLKHLAAEHNFLPGFSHRAVFDVLTMLKILSMYDIKEVIARASEPTLYVQALVDFANNQKAKDHQFRWHAPSKAWWRSYKSSDLREVEGSFDFKTRMLTGPLE